MGRNNIMHKVSVLMATYNRAHLLPNAVLSFLEQDYGNCELLILNNGSTDFTDQYLATLKDHRNIRVFHSKENRKDAANYLWSKATGELVCVLCDDDQFTRDSISVRVKEFEKNPELEVVYGGVQEQDILEKKLSLYGGQSPDKTRILTDEYINFTTLMWRRDLQNKFVFDTDLYYYQDWFFKIRCLWECEVGYVHEPVMNYTIHLDQESVRLRGRGAEDNKIMREKLFKLYGV